jgi:hypothetical protein
MLAFKPARTNFTHKELVNDSSANRWAAVFAKDLQASRRYGPAEHWRKAIYA